MNFSIVILLTVCGWKVWGWSIRDQDVLALEGPNPQASTLNFSTPELMIEKFTIEQFMVEMFMVE